MIGLVAKDFLVFKKICKPAYRLLGIILLLCACIFIPQAAIPYISLLLPLMGVAFLTELVTTILFHGRICTTVPAWSQRK